MIPLHLYVGFPAILALLLIVALGFSLGPLRRAAPTVVWSYRLAWVHLGLAVVAVALTANDAISRAACATAFSGIVLSAVFAALDGLVLLWWLVSMARAAGRWMLPRPLGVILLRLSVHAALTGSFLWCSLLCTV